MDAGSLGRHLTVSPSVRIAPVRMSVTWQAELNLWRKQSNVPRFKRKGEFTFNWGSYTCHTALSILAPMGLLFAYEIQISGGIHVCYLDCYFDFKYYLLQFEQGLILAPKYFIIEPFYRIWNRINKTFTLSLKILFQQDTGMSI